MRGIGSMSVLRRRRRVSWCEGWLLRAEGRGAGGLRRWCCVEVVSRGGGGGRVGPQWCSCGGRGCGDLIGRLLLLLSVCHTRRGLLQTVEVCWTSTLSSCCGGRVSASRGVEVLEGVRLNDALRLVVYGVNRYHNFLHWVRRLERLTAGSQRLPVLLVIVVKVKVHPSLVGE